MSHRESGVMTSRIPARGEIWSVAGDSGALALVVDPPLRELGERWWGVVRVERDADTPTLRAGDTTAGEPLRLELGDQLVLPHPSLGERVGALTAAGEAAVDELFETAWPPPAPQRPAPVWVKLRAIHADALAASTEAADAFKRTLLDALAVESRAADVRRALIPACAPMRDELDGWPGAAQWRAAERALREALQYDIEAASLRAVPGGQSAGAPRGWPLTGRRHGLRIDVLPEPDGQALVIDGIPDELELSAPVAIVAPTPGIAPSAWAWSTPGVLLGEGPVDGGRMWFSLPGDVSAADVSTIARSLLLLPPALGR